MPRGMAEPLATVLLCTPDIGVQPITGRRANEVLWWHVCPAQGGWCATMLPLHTLIGTAQGGDLTVRDSVVCTDCGRHGWLTSMRWVEA